MFVLAGGARVGSTLLQRLLISNGEIMIWGEHGGLLLAGLQRMVSWMARWIEREGRQHWEVFRKEGWNNWIPNVTPPLEATVSGARRYEDIVADPEAAITSLAAHVGVDPGRFDRKAIELTIKGVAINRGEPACYASSTSSAGLDAPPIDLNNLDRAALAAPEVRRVCAQPGYAP